MLFLCLKLRGDLMDIWHILAIILFTTQVVGSLYWHGKTIEVSFFAKVFWVIVWNVILYNGGFW